MHYESFYIIRKSKNASKNNQSLKVDLKLAGDFANERNLVFEQKQNKALLQPEYSKSLLSVPSIYIDNLDSVSTISTPFDTPSNYDTKSMCDERSIEDLETVSMIVRNVEEMEKIFFDSEMASTSKESVIKEQSHHENKKHHDFIHDLKGTIQEKFHHLVHHDASHKKELPHDYSKSKEILHDFRENFSGKMHQIAEKIHHIHLPHTHHHEDNLISQAMQTILLEQFNIAEASTSVQKPTTGDSSVIQKRKSSSSSLQSIKQKFNLFQRPRRSVELQSETNSLNSISEVNSGSLPDKDPIKLLIEDGHPEEKISVGSYESAITIIPLLEQKAISKDDLKLSVQNFDSFISNKKSCDNYSCKSATFIADTNKKPLHESLLSLSRNELLSASPNVKTHTRTESIGCKFSASPSKQQQTCASGGSLPASTAIYRRSSDSDLSITPKGEHFLKYRSIFIDKDRSAHMKHT